MSLHRQFDAAACARWVWVVQVDEWRLAGKPLFIIGAALLGLGLLSFIFSNHPQGIFAIMFTFFGLLLVGIAAASVTSGSSVAHRGEEQIPVVYNIPAAQPQLVQQGEVQVSQPEQSVGEQQV